MQNYMHVDENAIYYECGYSCDNALFIRLGSESFFITDSRYTLDAREHVQGAQVIIDRDLVGRAAKLIDKHHVKRIAYDPKEWKVAAYERLASRCKAKLVAKPDMSHRKRLIKSDEEIALLDIAAALGAKAFDRFAEYLRDKGLGKKETELTWKAKAALSHKGKYELSFDPIVAIGPNAAKPHALPTKRALQKHDLLLVDAGLKYKRYCSDRTRTVAYDKGFAFDYNQRFPKKKIQKAYDTVLKAHDRAIAKARSGMQAKQIDALAREVIEKAGFGEYFVHSTGHGVGLDIHEMPYIAAKSKTTIEDGMVFTIEPGIYLPDTFGIRIEDTVVMRNGRAEILGV